MGACILMPSSILTIYEKGGVILTVSKERRPAKYYNDVNAKIVLLPVAQTALVALVIGVIMVWFVYALCYFYPNLCIEDKIATTQERNRNIEKFNQLSDEARSIVKELYPELEWQEDENVLELEAPPKPSYADKVAANPSREHLMLLLRALVAFLLFVFLYYWMKTDYYLADFPLDTHYGKLLLVLCLPLGWPFICVSLVQMRRRFGKRPKPTVATNQTTETRHTEEKSAPAPVETKVNVSNEEDYIKIRTTFFTKVQERAIRDVAESINITKDDLKTYGDKIQTLQKHLGQLTAKQKYLDEAKKAHPTLDRQTALDELEQIRKMRGVTEIIPCPEKSRIDIIVKIRVPYQGSIYDFGDYKIRLWHDNCNTVRLRCGVKEDATSTAPYYHDGSEFCFGNRRNEIIRYSKEGRIIEALTLMIDCMHSVNEGDQQDIPHCFKRVSDTSKKPKKQPEKQKKHKGGKKR